MNIGIRSIALTIKPVIVPATIFAASDTPPTGVGGFFNVTSDNAACALRAATPSPGRSLVFYVAQ